MWSIRRLGLPLAILLALGPTQTPAGTDARREEEPAATLTELWRRLGACTRVSRVPVDALGSEVTVLFSIRRDGSLQGEPRITYSRLYGDEAAQRGFIGNALADLARCFPISITDGLGGAVAGRPFRLRLTSPRGERGA
ncbi:hypothetical protein [Methylobacterium sp. A54F]